MNTVYHYISYRKYLADFYAYKKEYTDNFSYRLFSAKAGIKLTNFLGWLIDGTRNLATKSIPGVIKALEFNEEEGHYFTLLVHFDQTKQQSEREELWAEIVSIRAHHEVEQVEEDRYGYFAKWYTVAIRELLHIVRFNPRQKDSYYKLGSMLRPKLDKKLARLAVKNLERLGLITLNNEGYFELTKKQLSTGDEAPGFYIKGFHKQMLERAADSMDLFPSEERNISSISMSISRDAQMQVKEAMQRFHHEVQRIVKEDTTPERLVQLNMQLFPLAEFPDEK